MATPGCKFLRFRRNTSRRATVNRRRTIAPTTPPAIAALFDLEWDVVDDTGEDDIDEGEVGGRRVKADMAKSGL